jgi:hypothetical protein
MNEHNEDETELSALQEEEFLRQASFQQPEQFLKAYLSDTREDLYQDFLDRDLGNLGKK